MYFVLAFAFQYPKSCFIEERACSMGILCVCTAVCKTDALINVPTIGINVLNLRATSFFPVTYMLIPKILIFLKLILSFFIIVSLLTLTFKSLVFIHKLFFITNTTFGLLSIIGQTMAS